MNSGLNVEKLKGRENYETWAFATRMLLIHDELWSYVNEGIPKKSEKPAEDLARDQKAQAKICLLLQPQVYVHVQNATTSKDCWDNLKKAFQPCGLENRISLLRQVVNLKLANCSSMDDYISTILSLAQQLASMRAPLDDEFIGVLMLNGLHSGYDPLVMALSNSNITVTSDLVASKLLLLQRRLQEEVEC